MSTTLLITPDTASSLRTLSAIKLQKALDRLLATFQATPDDKLDFKPSETAKSIRELVIHSLDGNGYVGGCIGIQFTPGEGPTDRASLESRLKESTARIIEGIQNLSDDQISGSVEFFGTPMPTTAYMFVNEWHISRHAGQIDYVQTIYGDLEDHAL
jgi:uncharacterized damage-inducible protein DinB